MTSLKQVLVLNTPDVLFPLWDETSDLILGTSRKLEQSASVMGQNYVTFYKTMQFRLVHSGKKWHKYNTGVAGLIKKTLWSSHWLILWPRPFVNVHNVYWFLPWSVQHANLHFTLYILSVRACVFVKPRQTIWIFFCQMTKWMASANRVTGLSHDYTTHEKVHNRYTSTLNNWALKSCDVL